MSRSWAEVKSLLDDPYVDADTKEHLLAAYIREEGYVYDQYNQGLAGGTPYQYLDEDRLPSEVRDYYDRYKLDAGDYYEGDLDSVYGDAEAERDERGYSAGLNDESVEDGRTDIEGMQAPTEGSTTTGVQSSDEIFEAARPALRLWEDFLPVNDKVPADSLGRYGKINLEEDIKKRFDEQMGISFRNFLDDAKRLRDAHTTLSGLNSSTQTELNSLYREWTGPAANASYQHYSEKLVPNVTDLLEYLQTAPDMIDEAVTNIFTACKDKANDVIALYQGTRGTVGSATPDIATKVVKLAGGDFDSQEEVLEVAAWVDSVCGSNLESTLRADDCGLNDENKEYTIRECKKWIRESFNADLHESMYVTFKQACDDALELVNTQYETLNNYLKEYENKFQAAGQNPSGDQTRPPAQSQDPSGQQPPGSSSTPPPSSSTPPSSSSTPPSSSSTPPQATMPPPPNASAMPDMSSLTPPGSSTDPSGATSPSGSAPGSSTLPAGIGTPGSSLPGAGAIDPATGLPIPGAGMTAAGGVPKSATIKDGDRTITVGQPDARGRSKVTVDDGKGEPREYEVDFTPDEPGETYEDGVIKAGPDGKAVIQDGDAAISLEQVPGQSSQMKMTVDDGTPTSYDFDFDAGADVPTPGTSGLPDVSTPSGMGGGGLGGGGGGVGGGGGGFGGVDTPGASGPSTTPSPGAMVGAQAPDTGDARPAAAAAAAGLGAGGAAGAVGGAPVGGMPMGGMGGGAGQGGGDQTRQSKWRTTGSLFDEQDPAANFSGIVGRDPAEKPKTPKR